MKLTLHIWRQKSADAAGELVQYRVTDASPDMSFLELLDAVNEGPARDDPVAFDYDCREGICGSCAVVINGHPHGPEPATTACQLYLRHFADGDELTVEPWRAAAFPVVKDLVVDRSALDRVIQAGGYVSVHTGSGPDANAIPVARGDAETSFEAATCIGCGACVAACPNASAMLFVAAKAAHLAHLPQGQPERGRRALHLVDAMDREGFGACSNHYRCEAACPKEISVRFIAELNRDYVRAALTDPEPVDAPRQDEE